MSKDAPTPQYSYDWADLAFGSKKPLRELKATFIAAPRELSEKRFKQLMKQYLPEGDIVLGVAKEPFVVGFEEQPQFRMLELPAVQKPIEQINAASPRHVYTLHYFQRELVSILEKLRFKKVLLVNGSWQYVFHSSPAYYYLASSGTPYEMVSPFTDEAEARTYETTTDAKIIARLDTKNKDLLGKKRYSSKEMLTIASIGGARSYDYSFQTGVALGIADAADQYTYVMDSFNKVVPYQTYALHHGSSREKYFSPPNDLNHYDAVHAEVELLIKMQRARIHLKDATMFINLMPCPTCARMLSETTIAEFVYSIDHSDGYAVKLLEAAGKTVRRVIV